MPLVDWHWQSAGDDLLAGIRCWSEAVVGQEDERTVAFRRSSRSDSTGEGGARLDRSVGVNGRFTVTVKTERPKFLIVAELFLLVQSCAILIMIYFAALATPDSTIQLTGEPMRVGDIRLKALIVLALALAFSIYVGLGVWRGNPIARHLFVGLFVMIVFLETFVRGAFIEIPLVVLVCGVVGWYFYAKSNVRSFFDRQNKHPT